jgi:hypothetical protein
MDGKFKTLDEELMEAFKKRRIEIISYTVRPIPDSSQLEWKIIGKHGD